VNKKEKRVKNKRAKTTIREGKRNKDSKFEKRDSKAGIKHTAVAKTFRNI